MNRRRILTGLVAAPFVARLGLLMPVRSIVSMQSMLASSGVIDFETMGPINGAAMPRLAGSYPYIRALYAIGLSGEVRPFLESDLIIDGQVPRLRPDHPLAGAEGAWDFTTLAPSPGF